VHGAGEEELGGHVRQAAAGELPHPSAVFELAEPRF
jgi:hypothetical protein